MSSPIAGLSAQYNAAWSLSVVDAMSGESVIDYNPGLILKTASLPKVFLLQEVAHQLAQRTLQPTTLVDRRNALQVTDAGLWQHLATDQLPITDVAALVGAFSDNLATNALLNIVGLDHLSEATLKRGYKNSRLLDYVRPERIVGIHPGSVSQGNAEELAKFCAEQERLMRQGDAVAAQVVKWLRAGADYSMVLRDLGLDPLSCHPTEDGLEAWNKTGTDTGVRADAGVIRGKAKTLAYSVICNWESEVRNREISHLMGQLGEYLRKISDE